MDAFGWRRRSGAVSDEQRGLRNLSQLRENSNNLLKQREIFPPQPILRIRLDLLGRQLLLRNAPGLQILRWYSNRLLYHRSRQLFRMTHPRPSKRPLLGAYGTLSGGDDVGARSARRSFSSIMRLRARKTRRWALRFSVSTSGPCMPVGLTFGPAGVMFSAPDETTCFRRDEGASSCAGTVDSLSSLRRFVPGFSASKWTVGGDMDCGWDRERDQDKGC